MVKVGAGQMTGSVLSAQNYYFQPLESIIHQWYSLCVRIILEMFVALVNTTWWDSSFSSVITIIVQHLSLVRSGLFLT